MNLILILRKVWDREWFQNLLAVFVGAGVFFGVAYYDSGDREIASEEAARVAFEQLLSRHLDSPPRLEHTPNWRLRDLGDGFWELNGTILDQEGGNRLIARARSHRKSGWHLNHLEIGNRLLVPGSGTPETGRVH
jgi:hypothetical protein